MTETKKERMGDTPIDLRFAGVLRPALRSYFTSQQILFMLAAITYAAKQTITEAGNFATPEDQEVKKLAMETMVKFLMLLPEQCTKNVIDEFAKFGIDIEINIEKAKETNAGNLKKTPMKENLQDGVH